MPRSGGIPRFWTSLLGPSFLGGFPNFWGSLPGFWGSQVPPGAPRSFPDEEGPKHWSPGRYEHVMRLRQEALEAARALWADFLLVREGLNWGRVRGSPRVPKPRAGETNPAPGVGTLGTNPAIGVVGLELGRVLNMGRGPRGVPNVPCAVPGR